MRAEFRSSLSLYKIEVYAVLEVERSRNDIKEYLQTNRENKAVNRIGLERAAVLSEYLAVLSEYLQTNKENKAVNKYLQAIGLLNPKNELTEKGNKFLKEGTLFQEEEGKYTFWYVKGPLVNFQLLYFQRAEFQKEINFTNNHQEITNLIGKHKVFQKENTRLLSINVQDIEKNFEFKEEKKISLIWQWELKKGKEFPIETKYFFEGSIEKEITYLNKEKFTKFLEKEDFKKIFKKNGYDWDEDLARLKIPFSKEYKVEELKNFTIREIQIKEKNFRFGNFEKANFSNVEVMPINREHAEEWKNFILEQEIQEKFFTPEQFSDLVRSLHNKEALKLYALEETTSQNFLEYIRPRRLELAKSYYHLAAPIDLNPFVYHQKPSQILTTKSGESKSFREILSQIKNQEKQVKEIICSDPYVFQKRQKKLFITMIESVVRPSSCKVVLFTRQDQFTNDEKSRIPNFEVIPMQKVWDTHDRFLIFKYLDNTYDIWKLSRGIDFLDFGNIENFTPETKGTTRQNSFIKMDSSQLENYLKERL